MCSLENSLQVPVACQRTIKSTQLSYQDDTLRPLRQKIRYTTLYEMYKRDSFRLYEALDFDLRVILSFRSPFPTWRFSLKIKSFAKQNMFYRSDILHDFSIARF